MMNIEYLLALRVNLQIDRDAGEIVDLPKSLKEQLSSVGIAHYIQVFTVHL